MAYHTKLKQEYLQTTLISLAAVQSCFTTGAARFSTKKVISLSLLLLLRDPRMCHDLDHVVQFLRDTALILSHAVGDNNSALLRAIRNATELHDFLESCHDTTVKEDAPHYFLLQLGIDGIIQRKTQRGKTFRHECAEHRRLYQRVAAQVIVVMAEMREHAARRPHDRAYDLAD